MKYCSNCGAPLEDEAKFCPKCGNAVGVESENVVRKQVFAGKVIKCPNCGTEIANSYVTKCPGCGFELGSIKSTNSLEEFKARIKTYDYTIAQVKTGYSTWGVGKKIGFILLCIYTVGIAYAVYASKQKKQREYNNGEKAKASQAEAEKKKFIEQYTFPNDRESLLDALIFCKERLYSLTAGTVKGEDLNWAQIWRNKAGHIYQKLEMLYPGDKYALEAYQEAEEYFKQVKKLKLKRTLIIWAIVIGVVVFSYVYTFITTGSWGPTK